MTEEAQVQPPLSAILRNRAVAIKLLASAPVEGAAPPAEVTVWLVFTANTVAAIEEHFETRTAFAKAFEEQSGSTSRACIAFALGLELEEAGARMIQEEATNYVAACEAAWLLANASTEETAGKVIAARVASAAMEYRILDQASVEVLDVTTNASRGPTSSRPGQRRAARLRSSGA